MARMTLTGIESLLKIRVRFWGVRGSFVTSDVRIGNHTSCVSIEYGDQLMIIDSGSGIIDCAQYIIKEYISQKKDVHITIFYSHRHKDHRDGLTSFYPIFFPNVHIHFVGFEHESERCGEKFLEGLEANLKTEVFGGSSFPVSWDSLASKRTFQQVKPGEVFTIPCAIGGDIKVLALEMNHPQRAFGFRFEIGGRIIADTMDHEADPGTELHNNIIRLADQADLQISEVQYTKARYFGLMYPGQKSCIGYGHIYADAAGEQAKEARVKLYATIHHEPMADFDEIQSISECIQDVSGIKTFFATQGQEVLI